MPGSLFHTDLKGLVLNRLVQEMLALLPDLLALGLGESGTNVELDAVGISTDKSAQDTHAMLVLLVGAALREAKCVDLGFVHVVHQFLATNDNRIGMGEALDFHEDLLLGCGATKFVGGVGVP